MIKPENFNRPGHKTRILIAPLDWGLGHATRCIPIISALIQQNCTVFVAAETGIKTLLQKEFPDLQFLSLKGYRVSYSRNKLWMPLKLFVQLPGILFRVYAEKHWLKRTVRVNRIDAIISDNRMGLFHKKIPCVYITHQLRIKTGSHITENMVQKIHYHFINKFSACWVPDNAGDINLAGDLSHPEILPKVPVTYIGHLSRFEKKAAEIKYDLCVLLSGPEPQRSIFEKIILKNLQPVTGKVCLIRGLPDDSATLHHNNPNLDIINHLASDQLNDIILQSELIISRCGYSTVMDLMKLQKRAILVPTPGQTEQEYLGRYLHAQQLFYTVGQENFSLPESVKNASAFSYSTKASGGHGLENTLKALVATLGN